MSPRKDLQLSPRGVEGLYDITKGDIGLQSSILHSWNSGQLDYREGISIGYNLMHNASGYNLTCFND